LWLKMEKQYLRPGLDTRRIDELKDPLDDFLVRLCENRGGRGMGSLASWWQQKVWQMKYFIGKYLHVVLKMWGGH
jgi:hypothetical protein